jgi:hypothetical protein
VKTSALLASLAVIFGSAFAMPQFGQPGKHDFFSKNIDI